jgi:UDPglucose 6-dehydrogenase
LVVLTEWNEFRALDLKRARVAMVGNVLVDLRNIYPEALAEGAGFIYYGIGRTLPPPASQPHQRRRGITSKSRDVSPV